MNDSSRGAMGYPKEIQPAKREVGVYDVPVHTLVDKIREVDL